MSEPVSLLPMKKTPSKFVDPCEDLAKMSYKCLENNPRSQCLKFFDEYKKCTKENGNQNKSPRK